MTHHTQRGESAHVDPDPRRHRLYRPPSRPAAGAARRGSRLHGHQPADREFFRSRQAGSRDPRRCQPVRRRDERDARREAVARHQSRLLARQRAPAARRVQAQYPRHGQLLRGGAGFGRQPGRLCQLVGGIGRTEILRRPARHRGRFPPRPRAICDAQDLQRMAGAGLPRKARDGDHRDPPGQRDRPGQDRRLGRSRLLHYRPGARQAGVSSRTRTRCAARSMSTRSPRFSPASS